MLGTENRLGDFQISLVNFSLPVEPPNTRPEIGHRDPKHLNFGSTSEIPRYGEECEMASNATETELTMAGNDIGQSLDKLRTDIAALTATVAHLASEGADSARSQFRDSAGRVVRGANAAGTQLYRDATTLGRDAATTAHIATTEIESQIARHPIATVLIAIGIGFAVGAMSHRRT
jgi:ElaB/YqjD/DUF883 family membrane-anchored ribosome-binding protein